MDGVSGMNERRIMFIDLPEDMLATMDKIATDNQVTISDIILSLCMTGLDFIHFSQIAKQRFWDYVEVNNELRKSKG
jgi:hypothetical protein